MTKSTRSLGHTQGFAGLLGSLGALRESLLERGSNLVVRWGALPEMLSQLVLECGAAEIIAEEEVEYRSSSVPRIPSPSQQQDSPGDAMALGNSTAWHAAMR